MHQNELHIDSNIAQTLLKQQFPELAHLVIQKINHFGTDNAIFKLGKTFGMRFPRIPSAAEQLEKEVTWLPHIAKHLSLDTPQPQYQGKSTGTYPYHWYIYPWIEGNTCQTHPPKNQGTLARDLANAIVELQSTPTLDAPQARRGRPLDTQINGVNSALKQLKEMGISQIENIPLSDLNKQWQQYLSSPQWDKSPAWLHADLLPSNILLKQGKLNSIIDFGLMGVGDPAIDLLPAWAIFDTPSREQFKDTLKPDSHTWERGKGWALSIALIILPYYKDSNPELVEIAKKIITALQSK